MSEQICANCRYSRRFKHPGPAKPLTRFERIFGRHIDSFDAMKKELYEDFIVCERFPREETKRNNERCGEFKSWG